MGVLGSVRDNVLREIIQTLNETKTIPGNEVYIGAIHTKINEQNDLTDEATVAFLDSVVENFITYYNEVK